MSKTHEFELTYEEAKALRVLVKYGMTELLDTTENERTVELYDRVEKKVLRLIQEIQATGER
jgi:hypothetical protein